MQRGFKYVLTLSIVYTYNINRVFTCQSGNTAVHILILCRTFPLCLSHPEHTEGCEVRGGWARAFVQFFFVIFLLYIINQVRVFIIYVDMHLFIKFTTYRKYAQ